MRALAVLLVLAGLPPAAGVRAAEHATPAALLERATAFMRRARETGDGTDYARARAAVERAEALDPGGYEVLRTRAWVLLGLHEFSAARRAAVAARARRPDDWINYANLFDACVELGDYACAAHAAERTMRLHPGLPAYTRIAHLRALLGDRAGAVEALELAARAGSRRDPESFAWTLVHLGHERFASGDLANAALTYEAALGLLPEYRLALAGLARVRAAEGRLAAAIDLYRRAIARVPSPDLVAVLGDVHAAAGDVAEAERCYALVEHIGRVAAATGALDGRQLALFYADHDRRPAAALRLARAEAAWRDDIHTADALAWVLHRHGRHVEAARAAHRALRLGTPDATLHYHAGMIAAALGRSRPAARHLRRALALNPYFDLLGAPRARTALAALEASRLEVVRR